MLTVILVHCIRSSVSTVALAQSLGDIGSETLGLSVGLRAYVTPLLAAGMRAGCVHLLGPPELSRSPLSAHALFMLVLEQKFG